MTQPLVSVVIPAFNAASTIDETLRSVRAQSWRALDIVVVDDGSNDATAELARGHAAADPRVRLLQQDNAGVAAARNTGWQAARSDLIAFVDADDLWTPGKIARQVAAFEAGGARVGLVYSHFAKIDSTGKVGWVSRPGNAGDVLRDLLRVNFVGNGSSVMIRRAALESANGFDSSLHRAGLQGCEDYLCFLRIAEDWHFAVVPSADVGYRTTEQAMSANLARMFRSWLMVAAEMHRRHPALAQDIDAGVKHFGTWLIEQAVVGKQPARLLALLGAEARWRARAVPAMMAGALGELLDSRRAGRVSTGDLPQAFQIGEPA